MKQTSRYSIIVPAYNEQAQLARTLPAMHAAMAGVDAAGELIVVDNNSSDATPEVARQHGARVVFEPVNMIAKARNAGGRAASSPVIIFVDADTTPTAELLNATLDALRQGDCVGGGAVIEFDQPLPWLTYRLSRLWNLGSRLLGYPAGCFFFCRKEAFDAVDGFSETVYASEEIWFARRLKRWGRSQRPRMKTRVLTEPITTSSRKMDDGPKMYGMLLLMFVFPFAVKFRGLCGYWYKRDNGPAETALDRS